MSLSSLKTDATKIAKDQNSTVGEKELAKIIVSLIAEMEKHARGIQQAQLTAGEALAKR